MEDPPTEAADHPDGLPNPTVDLSSNALFPFLTEFEELLADYRQEGLLSESNLATWCRDRDIHASPVGELEALWRLGWLRADQVDIMHRHYKRRFRRRPERLQDQRELTELAAPAGRWRKQVLYFHPFRSYTISKLTRTKEWRQVISKGLYQRRPKGKGRSLRRFKRPSRLLKDGPFCESIDKWNGVVDLAILLEPIYWPDITSHYRGRRIDSEGTEEWEAFRAKVLTVFASISKERIESTHGELRREAALIDRNGEIYLLIRAMDWDRRKEIRDSIGRAMWIRHMAELIRLAYEEVYSEKLPHEDVAFGIWFQGMRESLYGSEYPLENIPEMVRRMTPRLGIASSVRVRFYVEGDTEEGALEAGLTGFLGYGVEVVNLRAQGWGTWLQQELENDVQANRLSMFMLDRDRKEPLKSLRFYAESGLIVGMVFQNEPDLELGCFSISQLVEATKYYEAAMGADFPTELKVSDFEGASTGGQFSARYQKLRLAPSPKSKLWGEALMQAAFDSPGEEEAEGKRLVQAVMCAIRGTTADYEYIAKHYPINPITLQTEARTDK